jgi:hypothetical protein
MMYKMPIGNYKWMSKSEIEQTDLATLDVMGIMVLSQKLIWK